LEEIVGFFALITEAAKGSIAKRSTNMKRISVKWLLVFSCLSLCAGCASLEPPRNVPGSGTLPPQAQAPAGTSDYFPMDETTAQFVVALIKWLVDLSRR
jgi:hypothetical protein